MTQTPSQTPVPPPQPDSGQGAPAADAIAAALANREHLMRSLAERRAEVIGLVETQKQEALEALQRARDMLDQAHPSSPPGAAPMPPSATPRTAPGTSRAPETSRERLRRELTETLALLSVPGGAASPTTQRRRDQAAAGLADAIADLIAEEIQQRLGR